MTQEEKYKLALFAVIRNSSVMPQGIKLGKTMHEINTMTIAVMANIMESCDFEKLKAAYEAGKNWNNHKNQDRYTPIRKEAEAWQEEDRRKKRVRSM